MHLVIAERNVDNNLSARVPAGVSANNLPFQPRASKTFPSRAYVTIFPPSPPAFVIMRAGLRIRLEGRRGGGGRTVDRRRNVARLGKYRCRPFALPRIFFRSAEPTTPRHFTFRISIPNFLTQLETRELTCKTFTLCFVYLFTCKICRIYRCSLFHLYLFR